MTDRDETISKILELADQQRASVADLSMSDIAVATGISRSSLYRRFESRAGLDAAVSAAGFEVGIRVSAEERLIMAAHQLIREKGIQYLTLETVAESANVALPTVYALFGNRPKLMRSIFTRYSPVPRIAAIVPETIPTETAAFQGLIESIYHTMWDYLHEERPLLLAIFSEITRDPTSEVMDWLKEEYVPTVANTIFPLLQRSMSAGILRPNPPVLTAQMLIGPMLINFLTRSFVLEAGLPLPGRQETCAKFAAAFCRANLKENVS